MRWTELYFIQQVCINILDKMDRIIFYSTRLFNILDEMAELYFIQQVCLNILDEMDRTIKQIHFS